LFLLLLALFIHLSFYTYTHTYNYKNAIHAVIVSISINELAMRRCPLDVPFVPRDAPQHPESKAAGRSNDAVVLPHAFKHTYTRARAHAHADAHTRREVENRTTPAGAETRGHGALAARPRSQKMELHVVARRTGLAFTPGCLQEEGEETRVNFTLRHTE